MNRLPTEFVSDRILQIQQLLETSKVVSIVGIPSSGISIFTNHVINSTPDTFFVNVDTYQLAELSAAAFFSLLYRSLGGKDSEFTIEDSKLLLQKLSEKHSKLVIVFNRFDQLKHIYNKSFFDAIRSLQFVNSDNIRLLFSVSRPIHQLSPQDLDGTDISYFSTIFYLTPYTKPQLKQLLITYGPTEEIDNDILDQALELSGGHFQLLQLLIKSNRINNPLLDPFIKLALQNIYESLDYPQKKLVARAAAGKEVLYEEYLFNVSIIQSVNQRYQLFSPLFGDYVLSRTYTKLPAKELRLFQILKKYLDSLVTKPEIFKTVWGTDADEITDWALHALVYRLKNNPEFKKRGYIIETHNKLGYIMKKL